MQTPGAAAGAAPRRGLRSPVFQAGFDRLGVVGGGLPLHKSDGAGGADRQAVPQPIAVVVPHKLGFALHHGDGALVAGGGAQAAAVAFFLVDVDDFPFHNRVSS